VHFASSWLFLPKSNTLNLVYVLPPEQYTQMNQDPYYQPPGFGQHQQSAYAAEQPPSFFEPQGPPINEAKEKRIELSLLARDTSSLPATCEVISAAFSLFSKHPAVYLAWLFCFWVVVGGMVTFSIMLGDHHRNGGTILVLGQLIFNIALIPLIHGLYYAAIQVSRSESAEMKLSYFYYTLTRPTFFLNLVVMSLVIGIIVGIGLILLVIPGVYFAICLMFAQLLFLEYEIHGLTWFQCMTISREVVSRNWCHWFGFAIVICLLSIVPFCLPIAMIAVVLAFRDTFGLIEQHEISLDSPL